MSAAKKTNEAKVRTIREQIRNGWSGDHGFLHIPKTGGSGVSTYGKELVKRGYRFPVVFPHGWTFREIRENFPRMKVSFILRDPLDRMISGFNSRLRQGRPTYNIVWTPAEAAAFTLFPSVRHWLDALLSDDEYHISSVNFAMRSIRHLHWNYAFYFERVKVVDEFKESFETIGSIDAVGPFVDRLTATAGAPAAVADELYEKRHESGSRASDALSGYSPDELKRIRNALGREFRIYQALTGLSESRAD